MSKVPNPDSRMSRALIALRDIGDVPHHDYLRILGTLCDTHEQVHNLGSHLHARGFVERIIRLTPSAVAATLRIKP